nr:MFS transporter [Corynebacterium sp. CNJ-954]
MILYVVNIFDRMNLGYVALDMRTDLMISAAAFGSLAAAFYIGYIFFEVPSNILLEKFGARSVISRIMITWGIVTFLMFFVTEYWQLYTLRVLLGIMEAGFFPGIVYYVSQWVPAKQRAFATTMFFVGSQFGTALVGPVSTWIMDNISWFGHAGWRWTFVLEGIPAIILGIVAWFYLSNRPKDAQWLTQEEQEWLTSRIASEREANRTEDHGIAQAFKSIKVWHLAVTYLLFQAATQGMGYWAPSVLQGFSDTLGNTTIGLILSVPPLLAIPFMMLLGRHSDRTGERKYHALASPAIAVVGILIAVLGNEIIIQVAGIVIYATAYPAFYGIFWTIPTMYLSGAQAAVGIAIINSTSSASTFASNTVIGILSDRFGNTGVLGLVGLCLFGSIVMLSLLRGKDFSIIRRSSSSTNSESDPDGSPPEPADRNEPK